MTIIGLNEDLLFKTRFLVSLQWKAETVDFYIMLNFMHNGLHLWINAEEIDFILACNIIYADLKNCE